MGVKNILSQAKELAYPLGSHIYFLLKNDAIVYIGKSNSLLARIGTHSREKDFHSVKYIEVPEAEQAALELALIKAVKPILNTQPLSAMTNYERELLIKYDLDNELLNAAIRAQPKIKENSGYGYVAFFNAGVVTVGFYDGEDYERNDNDHEIGCKFIAALDLLGDIDDNLRELLCEKCNCPPRAIVLSGMSGYYVLDFDELYSIEHDDFKDLRKQFGEKFKRDWEERAEE